MSGGPKVILLDSNAYFRLAQSIRPLLKPRYGPPPSYSLLVLKELDQEYLRSARLRSRFNWFSGREYVSDREKNRYTVSGAGARLVDIAFSYLARQADSEGLNLAREDIQALAVGHARGFPVVTDDRGMQRLAGIFGIECWSTLALLKHMVDHGRIDFNIVRQVVEYWHAEQDLPWPLNELRRRYKEFFSEDCPI